VSPPLVEATRRAATGCVKAKGEREMRVSEGEREREKVKGPKRLDGVDSL
jgi:hypothetical protein